MENNEDRDYRSEMRQCQIDVEERLRCFFSSETSYSGLLEAMRYSLLAGGKRIRAVMCIKFCEAAGGRLEAALDAACAIEMLHAYSLIHDDLPCMDNSDTRRGKPSNHIKFGESTATLAGDALQAAAFGTLLDSELPPAAIIGMAQAFAHAAGPHGICGGQYLDLLGESKIYSSDEVAQTHSLKTAALISASARIGVVAAGGSPEQVKAAEEYALAVGLAFQIRDDVLDVTASEQNLGKPVGSDRENEKNTFTALMGLDACEDIIAAETEKAIGALSGKFDNGGFLVWFARMLSERKY